MRGCIADDSAKIVAQRRNRHHRRKAAAVFTDVSQLVNVFDAARGLEDQRLEAWRNRGFQLEAQGFSALDHFPRIGNIGGSGLIHHLDGRVAQHALGADVEDLNDALRVSGDTREIGAVKNRVLKCPCLQHSRRTLVTTSTVPAASSGMAGSWYCADMYQPPSGYKTYSGFSSTPPAFAGGYRLGGCRKPRVRRTSGWRAQIPAPRRPLRFLPKTRSPQEKVHRSPSSLRRKKLAGNVIDKQLRLGLGGKAGPETSAYPIC